MRLVVQVRLLAHDPFLWCWDAEDSAGTRIESSWENHWDAFASPEEALRAALAQLGARVGPGGVKAEARMAARTGPSALVIVRRDDAALYASLTEVFRARESVHVIRDRRSGERRLDRGRYAPDRRRGDRRSRSEIDAQVRGLGWSALFPIGQGSP